MSTRRGPYRKPKRLTLAESKRWRIGDALHVGAVRWIITQLSSAGDVVLTSSNTVNHAIRWTTTTANLPERTQP